MDYPSHLYEKIRQELAICYLKHELRKIFPSIRESEIENLMSNKELCTPRDFWNGVHGVGMGFKLQIGLIYLITAKNILWTKEKIQINKLYFGVEREITKLAGTREVKKIIESKIDHKIDWTEDKRREFDPIIVTEKDEGLVVYEGNGRLDKFILEKRGEIEAYVGRYTTEIKKPINYWLPTSILMDVLFFAYEAVKKKDDELLEKYCDVLKDMIKDSESGKYEFLERALTNKKDIRDKILAGVCG